MTHNTHGQNNDGRLTSTSSPGPRKYLCVGATFHVKPAYEFNNKTVIENICTRVRRVYQSRTHSHRGKKRKIKMTCTDPHKIWEWVEHQWKKEKK